MAFAIAHIFGHNSGMHMVELVGFTNTWYIVSLVMVVCIAILLMLKRKMRFQKIEE